MATRELARQKPGNAIRKPFVHLFPVKRVHELAHPLGHDGHLGTLPSPRGHRHDIRHKRRNWRAGRRSRRPSGRTAYLPICWRLSREWRADGGIRHPTRSTPGLGPSTSTAQGSFYDNKAQAVAAATSMRPHVTQSIDVGCMQISLTNHPDAFASMDQAFDPSSNADYGARFLVQLFAEDRFLAKGGGILSFRDARVGPRLRTEGLCGLPEETKLAYAAEPAPLANGWAMTPNRSLLISPFAADRSYYSAGGRSRRRSRAGPKLDSYRSAPVRMAFRAP